MTPETKAHIDTLSYEQLLEQLRFDPAGHPRWQGEEGNYRMDRMRLLREQGADHVGASKRLGWER